MLRREMFISTKPQTVSVFFAGVIRVGGENEHAPRWDFTFSIWVYSWFSQCIQMTIEKVCTVLLDSSVISFSAYQYNFRNENSICRFSQPMGKKGSIHTFISCCIDIPRRKVLETPSRVTSTPFISLLTSIMKMLSHLSDKNHLFQELWRHCCATALVLWFHPFILSLTK